MAQGSGNRHSEMKVSHVQGLRPEANMAPEKKMAAIAENQMKRKRGGPSMGYIHVSTLLPVPFKRVGCGVV